MFFSRIGSSELLLILAIALILFGPRKLPEMGRALGKTLREFRQAASEVQRSVNLEEEEVAARKEPGSENAGSGEKEK